MGNVYISQAYQMPAPMGALWTTFEFDVNSQVNVVLNGPAAPIIKQEAACKK